MATNPILATGVALVGAAAIVAAVPTVIPTSGPEVTVDAAALTNPRSLSVEQVQLLASLTEALASIPDVYFNGYGEDYQAWVDYQIDRHEEVTDEPNAGVKGVINLITDALVPDVEFLNDSPYFDKIEHIDSDYLHGGLLRTIEFHLLPIVEDLSPFEGRYLRAYLEDGLLAGTLAAIIDDLDDELLDIPSAAIRGFVAAGFAGAIAAILEKLPAAELTAPQSRGAAQTIQVSVELPEDENQEPLSADFDLGGNTNANSAAKAQSSADPVVPVKQDDVTVTPPVADVGKVVDAAVAEPVVDVNHGDETVTAPVAEVENVDEAAAVEPVESTDFGAQLANAGAEFTEAVNTAKAEAAERRAAAKERAQERRDAFKAQVDDFKDKVSKAFTGGSNSEDRADTNDTAKTGQADNDTSDNGKADNGKADNGTSGNEKSGSDSSDGGS